MTHPEDEAGGFEEALQRLEMAVTALEGGELGLDQALARYEEGVRLLGRCRAFLDHAERRVALVAGVDELGNPVTTPFDGATSGGRTATDE